MIEVIYNAGSGVINVGIVSAESVGWRIKYNIPQGNRPMYERVRDLVCSLILIELEATCKIDTLGHKVKCINTVKVL